MLTFPAAALAGPPSSATVRFGNDTAAGADQNCFRGSQGVTPENCAHGYHKMIPGAVSISTGGDVTFTNEGTHQVLIFNGNPKPQEIVPANPGRVVAVAGPPFQCGESGEAACPTGVKYVGLQGSGVIDTFSFSQPGQYLVICNITPHFEQGMWGWVNVQ